MDKITHLKKFIFILLSLLFIAPYCKAQSSAFTSVKGLPTKEIYDLLVDKKGFLWIAHDLGLSRFDGVSFVDYHCADQMALSITDLVEDRFGRIWAHNFNGQIFYAEQEKLHLLKEYAADKETRFPRIALLGDELIATSTKGLFICNVNGLKCRYVSVNSNKLENATTALTILKNRVIAYGNDNWFSYQKGQPLKRLSTKASAFNSDDYYLQPIAYKDTLYLTSNFLGVFKKLLVKGDSMLLVKTERINRFVNTISKNNNTLWINTKTDSYSADRKKQIPGLNLTDIVTDRAGNTWYSSLKNGLMVDYKTQGFLKSNPLKPDKGDFVRSMVLQGDMLACGTQDGEVILYNIKTNKILFRKKIDLQNGAIEKVNKFANGNFVVSASVGNWILDVAKRTLTPFDKTTSKDNDVYRNLFFNGTANFMSIRIINNQSKNNQVSPVKYFPWIKPLQNEPNSLLIDYRRSRAIKFDSVSHTLYAAMSDGLHKINALGNNPVSYNGKNINASSIACVNGYIYVSDFNRGLFIIKGQSISNISIDDGLLSTTLLKIKAYNNHLYIISEKGLQLFDIAKNKFNTWVQLPSFNQGIIYDIMEFNDIAWIATSEGIYKVNLDQHNHQATFNNYLQYTVINSSDTITTKSVNLPYYKNNVRFKLTVPLLDDGQQIYFKYRLLNNGDKSWNFTRPGERDINYAALMPGRYVFEAIATAPNGVQANNTIRFGFSVEKPWWLQLWFIALATLIAVTLIFGVVRAYYTRRLKRQSILHAQELAIEMERQRISSEIHDEIGAGLSALRLYTNVLEEKNANQPVQTDIAKINTSVSNLSAQLREVIWTLNTDHDTVENLIFYLQQQAAQYFEGTGITLKFSIPDLIPPHKITGEKRRNVYLALKESMQNILKHARASQVEISTVVGRDELIISVADNGVGLQPNVSVESSGLIGMKRRLAAFGGKLRISSKKGTRLTFYIPLT
jgi:signal transduction histidine kinase